MTAIRDLMRNHLRELVPYSSARDEYQGNQGIFLDANENAIGSIGMGHWNRYPDPHQRVIKHTLAVSKKVNDSNVFVGNGSDEPIDLLIRAFCEPEVDEIITFPPTYGMYKVSASINNVKVNEVLLTEDFQIDIDRFRQNYNANTKIIFICSPNNPTGNSINAEAIRAILDEVGCLVVIDEAYIDFSYRESWVKEILNYDRLIVLQTFSKAWGLASLRTGIAYANTEVNDILTMIKPPYNLSGPVQEMIINALRYNDVKRSWIERLNREREKLAAELKEIEIIKEVFPSDANFLLVRFENASEVFKYLIKNKVIVRDRSSHPLCDGCLRISVGTDHENARLIQVLNSI